MRIDTNLAMRAALVQAAGVLVLGLATGLALSHAFFEDWGWLVGPAAWLLAATATALVLQLPLAGTLLGAALAGIPSARRDAPGPALARRRPGDRPVRPVVRRARARTSLTARTA